MRRAALVLVTLLWWLIVFASSGDGASGSWTERLLAEWFGLTGSTLEVTNFIVRKAGHVLYYGILAILVGASLYGWVFSCRIRSIVLAAILSIGTGAFDEMRQATFSNRTGTPLDLLYDSAGIAVAVWVFLRATRGK